MALTQQQTKDQLLSLTTQFTKELNGHHLAQQITTGSYLDRDLSIDSIGKVEFFHRIEKHFNISLPESALAQAETLDDILTAIENAQPRIITTKRDFAKRIEKNDIDPSSCKTLVDVLVHYTENAPDRPHIYLHNDAGEENIITYGELFSQSKAIARGLIGRRLKSQETVAIMLPTCADFFYSFFGVLLAGGIPVPIYPPFRPDQIGEYAIREAAILKNAEVKFLITFDRAEMLGRLLRIFIPSLKSVVTADDLRIEDNKKMSLHNKPNDAGLIQYTSGSTSAPKGVFLTHKNLLANIRAYGKAADIKPYDRTVSWLPLYHDMGLIGAWLGSFYYGLPVTIMSPLTFLARPSRWLWAMHYHRATISGGPNFAYELCTRKISDDEIEGLDLSHWRLAVNGAEAVNPNTLRRFIKRFEPYGFKSTTMYPVYGLAENCVALTFPPLESEPYIDKIDRNKFQNEQIAMPVKSDDEHSLEFVDCGAPLEHHDIRIVNDEGVALSERQVGHLQFKGPSAMQGYYRNPEATARVRQDEWWHTGDRAYIANHHLFITGRSKDVIVKAGRKIHPEEIEDCVNQVEGIRKGCVVAFGVHDQEAGTEKLIVVAESHESNKSNQQKMKHEIIDRVSTVLGIPPDRIVIVPPHSIPKTSSGKLRRSSCKADYEKGALGRTTPPTWMQVILLIVSGLARSTLRFFKRFGKLLYTTYVILISIILILPMWIGVQLLNKRYAQRFAKVMARTIFRCIGCPIKIIYPEKMKHKHPVIYASNHSSYIDALIFMAVLPPETVLVGKHELQQSLLFGSPMKKLGYVFVNRFDFSQSIEDATLIQQRLEEGNSIGIFPEGTFANTTGLLPFKMGAFKIASDTMTPICPLAIKGNRRLLSPGSNLFTPSKITITFGDLIKPDQSSWDEATRLRLVTRVFIEKHSGETHF